MRHIPALKSSVLSVAYLLGSSGFRDSFKAAGHDYKVMGSRLDSHHRLTIALAFVDKYVHGVEEYFALKHEITSLLARHIRPLCEIEIN
jgi:S-adenosylmethionine synthetase